MTQAIVALVALASTGSALASIGARESTLAQAARNGSPRALPQAPLSAARGRASVATTSATAPGNQGYVHFFVITGPDGVAETEVGIELPHDRVVWSFPGVGVVVSPFIATGVIEAGGASYEIEHLYGIRPFPDRRSMQILRQELVQRTAPWLEEKMPYCDDHGTTARCLSCLGFVLRVLFPGADRDLPALPRDFRSARGDVYTTEDLLLYLTGVPVKGPVAARKKRIAALSVPDILREDLERIAGIAATRRATKSARRADAGKAHATPAPAGDLPRRVLPRRRS